MLQSLHVRDLALVARAELQFHTGLNVLSGATGGGKSLVLAALELLRGERSRGDLVRNGAEELRVDAEFELGAGDRTAAARQAVREILGHDPEEEVLLVSRIVDRRGRSRVRIDGRPATLRDLRTLGSHLLEIHRQGESRSLMRPEIQAETLDGFGDLGELRRNFAAALKTARGAVARAERVAGDEELRRERIELCRARLAEFDAVGLEEGELDQLEDEHRVLGHLDALREHYAVALGALVDGEPSASELLGTADRALDQASAIDRELEPVREMVQQALVHLQEAERTLTSRRSDLDLDPNRLAWVDERLGTIRRALSRHGPSEQEYFARIEHTRHELEQLDGGDTSDEALQAAIDQACDELRAAATALDEARRAAAERLQAAIETELEDLAMPEAQFRVAFDGSLAEGRELVRASTPHGPIPVQFEVRLNPGEPFTPMSETASGGELARIVLSVKKCLADLDRVPLVVFDEIDSEIGGRLGLRVGGKLKDVAEHHQVLIVTHLPQVAAFADAHFKVEKAVRKGRTESEVRLLDDSEIDQELAAMSGADDDEKQALTEARRLRKKARTRAVAPD